MKDELGTLFVLAVMLAAVVFMWFNTSGLGGGGFIGNLLRF